MSIYFSFFPNLFNNYASEDNLSHILEFHPHAQNVHGFRDDKLCFKDEGKKHYSYESFGKYKGDNHIPLETPLIDSSLLTINEWFPCLNNELVETEFFIKTSHDSHSFDDGMSNTIWDDTSFDSRHSLQFQPTIIRDPHSSCIISQSGHSTDSDH